MRTSPTGCTGSGMGAPLRRRRTALPFGRAVESSPRTAPGGETTWSRGDGSRERGSTIPVASTQGGASPELPTHDECETSISEESSGGRHRYGAAPMDTTEVL